MKINFLIVDDQQSIRKLCVTIGASLGFLCEEAESAESALAYIEANSPDIILVDLRMAEMSGLEFLARVKNMLPRTEVALMTGYGSIESAVQAMKLGAYDYITKPFRVEELKLTLQRMAEKVRLVAENEFLRERFQTETALHGIVGSHAKIQDVLRMIARLKDTHTPVLITGESGTGKELVARAVHFRGPYSKRPFVAVDCGALVPTLIESELFGHDKGAFTGAVKAKEGLFQAANGGTIFLDEIGELPLDLQAKLLRVLQEKEVRPVGSNKAVRVEVRVIAATNRDLEKSYREGSFRKDLYFRLNVVAVHLPSLRERRSDIPMLAQHFLDRYAPDSPVRIRPEAMNAMLDYDWPGNVRELENCVERAIALGCEQIGLEDLPPAIAQMPRASFAVEQLPTDQPMAVPSVASAGSSSDLEEIERATIQRVFDEVDGDKALAGRLLGISRATLYRKIKRYRIQAKPKAAAAAAGRSQPRSSWQ
ncbi:MAG TPA: sigma-54 dependent transcriptional regulator [Clostridia bacterium]|nr:sigma-54 dependent transcriptional regulator [Clostridia bacterium]